MILHLSVNLSKNNVAKTSGFSTFPKIQLILHLIVNSSKNNVAKPIVLAKTNDSSNILFGIVVKPIVLATLLLELLWNQYCLGKCCKTNGFNNIIFENVVKQIVLTASCHVF